MATLDTLNLSPDPIDDRWTESKLTAAGYHWSGDPTCRDCGDGISLYYRETLKGKTWLRLDVGVLSPHRCGGR